MKVIASGFFFVIVLAAQAGPPDLPLPEYRFKACAPAETACEAVCGHSQYQARSGDSNCRGGAYNALVACYCRDLPATRAFELKTNPARATKN